MSNLLNSIVLLAILTLIIVLYKKGFLEFRMTTKNKFINKRFNDKIDISYKKFDGFEYYYFWFKKKQSVTFKYDVTVEEGSLTLEIRSMKRSLRKVTLTEDGEGELAITTKGRSHSVRVDGRQTRGSCQLRIFRG